MRHPHIAGCASGQLSWLSPTPVPDLGGDSAIATDGDGSREVDSPELSAPGMYRVVCVELQIDNLAVNTVLESRSLNGLEGVDLSMEAVRSAETGDTVALAAANDGLASEPADDSIACASSFRTLKHLVQDWMRAVLEESDPIADQLLLNMYRWLSSSTSLMHDPALHRMLHLLMKKVWLQLLAEIRSLGARVVYASFTRVTIAVDKASVRDGEAYYSSYSVRSRKIKCSRSSDLRRFGSGRRSFSWTRRITAVLDIAQSKGAWRSACQSRRRWRRTWRRVVRPRRK